MTLTSSDKPRQAPTSSDKPRQAPAGPDKPQQAKPRQAPTSPDKLYSRPTAVNEITDGMFTAERLDIIIMHIFTNQLFSVLSQFVDFYVCGL